MQLPRVEPKASNRVKPKASATYVYLNDRIVPASRAKISVFDRGFLYGEAIFETLRVERSRPFRPELHFARLKRSAESVGLPLERIPSRLDRAVDQVITRNRMRHGLIRITISRGASFTGPDPSAREAGLRHTRPTLVVSPRISRPYPEAWYTEGIGIVLRKIPPYAPRLVGVKSTNLLGALLAREEARDQGAREAVTVLPGGRITEGLFSNIFVVTGGLLRTPSPAEGLLPGVMREAVLEAAVKLGIDSREDRVAVQELLSARECFLTNVAWGVMPVVRVDEHRIGSGRPGELTLRLQEALRSEMRHSR